MKFNDLSLFKIIKGIYITFYALEFIRTGSSYNFTGKINYSNTILLTIEKYK